MKRILNCAIVVLAILFTLSCKSTKHTQGTSSETITVLTYNVRNCLGLDNTVNYQRVANVISKINPDVATIQELDSVTNRSKQVSVLHELARLTGLVPTYHASINYSGGKYGIGILSKEKPLNVEGISLPGAEEKRSAVVVEMKNYVFVCTHFSLTEEDRIKSVALIDEVTAKYSKPVLLGGDLNATPNSSVVKAFAKNWNVLTDTTKLTIPANNPTECIDYILSRKQKSQSLKVLQTVVGNEPVASDHLPVWIQLRVEN